MTPKASLATKVARSWSRGKLLTALEGEKIIKSIILGENAQFILHTTTWDDYWKDVQEGFRDASGLIENLHVSWSRYIRSGFDAALRREYCHHYALLLDALLEESLNGAHSEAKKAALNQALAFECFGIKGPGPQSTIMAGGTSTLRNPNYLLSKLARPKAVDDPQYLPLITVTGEGPPALFYYYRQHKLSVDTEFSALLFLSTSPSNRPQSFHILNRLESLLGEGIDPRADERAARIANGILQPYLQSLLSSRVRDGALDFELIDIGSGSGLLAAQVSQHVARFLKGEGIKPTIRVCMIDLSMAVASRFFKGKNLGKAIDCITSIGADYKTWLSTGHPVNREDVIRIGLVSRFFNNLSRFKIEPFPIARVAPGLDKGQGSSWRECLPSRCLAPDGPGPEKLVVNNTIIPAGDGRSFLQPSLSNYFQALNIGSASRQSDRQDDQEEYIYLPIRAFDPECLITAGEESAIEKLLDECDLLIIQDSDLSPAQLKEHGPMMTTPETSAIDVTKGMGLRRHYSYAMVSSRAPAIEAWQGERLW